MSILKAIASDSPHGLATRQMQNRMEQPADEPVASVHIWVTHARTSDWAKCPQRWPPSIPDPLCTHALSPTEAFPFLRLQVGNVTALVKRMQQKERS